MRVDKISARSFELLGLDRDGNEVAICETFATPNNREVPDVGSKARSRVTTQFAPGIPAESESIPGAGAMKPGEILIQHQMHDGRGICRLVSGIIVDKDGGLECVIDSTTNDPSGHPGQLRAAPVTINVGEANGQYLTRYADGRIKLRQGEFSIETTVAELTDLISLLRGIML
jgi:hypothetical protein